MFRRIVLSVLLLIVALAGATRASDTFSVRVAHFPPYSWQDSQGQWQGLHLDILRAIASAAGYTLEPTYLPRRRAHLYLKTGELNAVTNFTETAERRKFADFIGPTGFEEMALAVHRDNADLAVSSLDDLLHSGLRIAYRETFHYPQLSERIKVEPGLLDRLVILEERNPAYVRLLAQKKVDAVFLDRVGMKELIRASGEGDVVLHRYSLNAPEPVHLAIGLGTDRQKIERIRDAYRRLAADGTLAAILRRYDLFDDALIGRLEALMPAPTE